MGGVHESDLVGTDNKHDAFHVGLRAHFLFHLPQPAVKGIETLPEADVVNQQHPLAVLIKLITNLKHRGTERTDGRGKHRREIIFLVKRHHLLVVFSNYSL